jgi:predicted nucleic acid-binding protein
VVRIEGKAVLDTNVILKMFFQEDDSDKADELLTRFESGDLQIVIPSFLALEFANVLWLRVRHHHSPRTECEIVLHRFLALVERMELAALEPFLGEVLAGSIRYDHAAYDIAFLVLAENLGVPFITADANLYRKVSARSESVVLLKNLEAVEY